MKGRSLRLRLLVASVFSIAVALAIAGLGLGALFERHVERRARAELATYSHQIAASLVIGEDGAVTLSRPLADPRFDQAFSGLYWQLREDGGDLLLRSRSLWDHVLPLPTDGLTPGIVHDHMLPGPQDTELMVQEQLVIYGKPSGQRAIRIAVGLDRREITEASDEFTGEMIPALTFLALVLIAAAWLQVSIGLRPLEAVRQGVNAIRARRRHKLEGRFPDEVMPLVSEVNDLLEAQDNAIERARMRAGDLAHGLKTPLTVLTGDARKLRERGEAGIADEIEDLARTMQHHIDRELTRTRIAREVGREKLEADLETVVGKLVATLQRTPRGEAIAWDLSLPAGLRVAVEPADLAEIAGNLLENAVKWGKSRIRVSAHRDGEAVILSIHDDGAGVPDEFIAALGQRGARLDEQVPGTGLGLAIAKEILEAYDGSLELGNNPDGGLTVTARLPA
ncbi:MAG: HAMP domain-containing histidine kinase [Alphaproteobacteria bacterium]|nr:HAMP domain-containing histidine kinase [Alphaproteobacteria bacterium]